MNINYRITFYNDWHCGSGLAAGADIDLLVVKDHRGLPYVPGKTIKGLVREAMQDLCALQHTSAEALTTMLGCETDNPDEIETDNPDMLKDAKPMKQGQSFFTNAELAEPEAGAIVAAGATDYLYRSIASTAIDPATGTADEHSLRRMQVTVPCVLHGRILDVPDDLQHDIERALRYIKRLGQSRNRGYGRCDITIEKGGEA